MVQQKQPTVYCIWTCLSYSSMRCLWTCLSYSRLCSLWTCHVCSTCDCVSSKVLTFLSYGSTLCCFGTCLFYSRLCCLWTCLFYSSLCCLWTCLFYSSLCCLWTYLSYSCLVLPPNVSLLQQFVLPLQQTVLSLRASVQ
jgi:hypothetical protein